MMNKSKAPAKEQGQDIQNKLVMLIQEAMKMCAKYGLDFNQLVAMAGQAGSQQAPMPSQPGNTGLPMG